MKHTMRNVSSALLVISGILHAEESSVEKIDYSRFALLFSRADKGEDPSARFAKLERLRSEAQDSLERLMKKVPSHDLEFRYGDLILARAKDLEQFGMELSLLGREKEAGPLTLRAKNLQKEALSRFAKILAKAGRHPLVPKIYLAMGRTELSLHRKEIAFNYSEQGLKALSAEQRGKSLETSLQILKGDAAFEMARASLAQSAYEKALSLVEKGSVEDAYLNYKLAWVFYNDKDSLKAVETLEKLFDLTRDRLSLRQEAVQDYGLFAADMTADEMKKKGDLPEMWKLLVKVSDEESATKAIERLGKVYAKNGRREAATLAFEFLIEKDPVHRKNIDRALTVVEWAHSLADKKKLTERYLWLLKDFGPRSIWYGRQKAFPDVQRLAFDRIESSLRKYATGLHQNAMKIQELEPRVKMEDAAAELYDAHIASFSEKARIYFYRAEIFRARKKWTDAGRHYDKFLHLLQLQPKEAIDKIDENFRDEASLGSVQVWAKAAEEDKSNAPLFLASADRFLVEDAKHPKAPQVALDAVKVELKSSSSSVALGRLDKLIAQFPKTEEAAQAVHAGLDLLNKENDYVNLALKARTWMDKLDAWAPTAKRKEIKDELYSILSKTEAKACESLSKDKGRELEGALCFEAYAKGFAKEALAPEALLMASQLFEKQKDDGASLRTLESLVTQYPNSKSAAQAYSKLALAYEKNFEFEKALRVYESLLGRKEKIEDREKILTRFLLLASSLGAFDKLEAGLKDGQVPNGLRKSLEERKVRKIFADYGRAESAPLWAQIEKIRTSKALPLDLELDYRRYRGVAQRQLNKLNKADEEWMTGLKAFWKAKDRSPLDWQAAARVRLEQASVWETVFKNTDLKKNTARKIELFQKLEGWYGEILTMKSPAVALEALGATAKLYAALATEMKSLPETAAKSEEFKTKALEILRQLSIRAQEWKVISPVALSSLKVLEDMEAGKKVSEIDFSLRDKAQLAFPWPELSRWVELNPETLLWKEWLENSSRLRKVIKNKDSRNEARRAAFVLLVRDRSFKDASVKLWADSFVEKSGIQMRIQAMIADHETARAQLFLEQYESLFGADAFAEHHWGRLAWSEGRFEEAYARWMHSRFDSDYRISYWQEGWRKLIADLSGATTEATRERTYKKLAPLAKSTLEKQSLAYLCFEDLNCAERGLELAEVLQKPLETPWAYPYGDNQSGWEIRRRAIKGYLSHRIERAKTEEELDQVEASLKLFGDLEELAENQDLLRATKRDLAERVSHKQKAIKGAKVVVGAAS